jgi:hypothetical protein
LPGPLVSGRNWLLSQKVGKAFHLGILQVDYRDLSDTTDERGGINPQNLFLDMMDEDKEIPASESSTSGVAMGHANYTHMATGEYFSSLRLGPTSIREPLFFLIS